MQHAADKVYQKFHIQLVQPLATPEQGALFAVSAQLQHRPVGHGGEGGSGYPPAE